MPTHFTWRFKPETNALVCTAVSGFLVRHYAIALEELAHDKRGVLMPNAEARLRDELEHYVDNELQIRENEFR